MAHCYFNIVLIKRKNFRRKKRENLCQGSCPDVPSFTHLLTLANFFWGQLWDEAPPSASPHHHSSSKSRLFLQCLLPKEQSNPLKNENVVAVPFLSFLYHVLQFCLFSFNRQHWQTFSNTHSLLIHFSTWNIQIWKTKEALNSSLFQSNIT